MSLQISLHVSEDCWPERRDHWFIQTLLKWAVQSYAGVWPRLEGNKRDWLQSEGKDTKVFVCPLGICWPQWNGRALIKTGPCGLRAHDFCHFVKSSSDPKKLHTRPTAEWGLRVSLWGRWWEGTLPCVGGLWAHTSVRIIWKHRCEPVAIRTDQG